MVHGTHEKYSSFGEFLVMLSSAAMKVFSGGKWDKKFPTVIDKGRLFLFWMDQKSYIFKGNGDALMGKVIENQIREAEEAAQMTFDSEGVEELSSLFPAWWTGVETEMRNIFSHYCQVADRLNVGPSACLNRFQFIQMMTDAGILSEDFKIPKINLVFQGELVKKEKRLRYERFLGSIAGIGTSRFPNVHAIKNAKSHFHQSGCALFYMLLEFMLPLASKVTAVNYAQKHRNHSERRPTEVRSSQWMERWRNIEVMREIMRADANIRAYFGVPDDIPEEVGSSEPSVSSCSAGADDDEDNEGDESDGVSVDDYDDDDYDKVENHAGTATIPETTNVSLLALEKTQDTTINQSQLECIRQKVGSLVTKTKVLSENLRRQHAAKGSKRNDISALSIDGLEIASVASNVFAELNTLEGATNTGSSYRREEKHTHFPCYQDEDIEPLPAPEPFAPPLPKEEQLCCVDDPGGGRASPTRSSKLVERTKIDGGGRLQGAKSDEEDWEKMETTQQKDDQVPEYNLDNFQPKNTNLDEVLKDMTGHVQEFARRSITSTMPEVRRTKKNQPSITFSRVV